MADEDREKKSARRKRPALRYFFLNDELHKKLYINRGKDLINAWNYPQAKRMTYIYSDVIRRSQKAFTTAEVCKMVNRRRTTIENALTRGMIEQPQHTYGLDENRNVYQRMWSEKDIMALLEYLSTVHRGRPRKDGIVVPQALPTPRELRAMIHDEAILYVKSGDKFIPSWRAKEI